MKLQLTKGSASSGPPSWLTCSGVCSVWLHCPTKPLDLRQYYSLQSAWCPQQEYHAALPLPVWDIPGSIRAVPLGLALGRIAVSPPLPIIKHTKAKAHLRD